MGLPEQIFAISERLLDRAGHPIDARTDPNDGTQYQWRQAKAGIAHHQSREPRTTNRMLGQIPAKGVDQDIHVGQNHLKRLIRST
jgi:hypothetical protein